MARRSKKWATSASGSQWPDESRAAHVSNGKMSILAVDRVGAMAPKAVLGSAPSAQEGVHIDFRAMVNPHCAVHELTEHRD